jgi:hypothetical protein
VGVSCLPSFHCFYRRTSLLIHYLYPCSTQVQITSPPTHGGLLYYLDGTPLAVGGFVQRVGQGDGNFTVRFRPPLDVCSQNISHVVSSFTFRAVDGLARRSPESSPGQYSTDNATVSVIVTPVPTPPVAAAMNTSLVTASITPAMLPQFHGTQRGSPITGAAITALPSLGVLYEVFLNLTVSKMPLTNSSSQLPVLLASGVFSVAYVYTGHQSLHQHNTGSGSGILAYDSFEFALQNAAMRLSVPQRHNITIKTPLVAVPVTQNIALEGQFASLLVGGLDGSGLNTTLFVRVTTFPQHGALYSGIQVAGPPVYGAGDGASSSWVVGGRLNDSNPTASAACAMLPAGVMYQGTHLFYRTLDEAAFFSTPNATWNETTLPGTNPDSFTYVVYDINNSLGPSLPETQEVRVRNVNGPTTLNFTLDRHDWPDGSVSIYAVSMARSSDASYPTYAKLRGFTLIDPDRDVDLVRVTITSTMGECTRMEPCLYFTSSLFFVLCPLSPIISVPRTFSLRNQDRL